MPSIVNQWTFSDTAGYGVQPAAVSNTAGNALVLIAAVGSDNGAGILPRINVCDDVRNWWVYAGSSASITPGLNRRLDVWVCPNAMAAKSVSVSSSWIYAGITGTILEVSGFAQFALVDSVGQSAGLGTSVSMSPLAHQSDLVFSAILFAGSNPSPTGPGAGWTALTTAGTGSASGDMSELNVHSAWGSFSAGTVTSSWSWTGNSRYSAVQVAFAATYTGPVQPNPNWPLLKAEAAFGFQPGNIYSAAMPAWTDITSRVIDVAGSSSLTAVRGREYPLTTPEAGTLEATMNNSDSAFNPVNSASPYYPNVQPETPVRVSAIWNGRQYGIAYSYASKWPQAYNDPQFGTTPYSGTDAVSTASNIRLPSCYAGEVLADSPYGFWPLGEYYASAHGAIFANHSLTSLKPMLGADYQGNGGINLSTGEPLGLAGDSSSGIGVSGQTQTTPSGGPGAFCRDYSFPPLASGITLECWAIASINPSSTNPNGVVDIMSLCGVPSNYLAVDFANNTTTPGTRLKLQAIYSGIGSQFGAVFVSLYQFFGTELMTVPAVTGFQAAQGSLHHYVITVSSVGSVITIQLYVDGALIATNSATASQLPFDIAEIVAGPLPMVGGASNASNVTVGQVAYYSYVLPAARIAAHYTAGSSAWSGVNVIERVGQLFAWSPVGLPAGTSATPSPSPQIGNADQIQGAALTDSLYALTVDEGGMFYAPADSQGTIWYKTRADTYNQSPKYVFGDNPALGEIPCLAGSGFAYDDSFIFNIVSSTRIISSASQYQIGASGQASAQQFNSYGADAVADNISSEQQFIPRGPLQQDIETTSDQDAYDRANWSLAKYAQPVLRADEIMVNAAANPAVFSTVLAVEQGDIVTVTRRPIGGVPISLNCIVQKVKHQIGPSFWNVTLTLAPYFPENNVLQADAGGYNVLNSGGVLGW